MPLRTIRYRASMLGLMLIFFGCMGFNREWAAWQGGSDDAI